MENNQKYLKVAILAAKRSGVIFAKYFGRPKKVGIKNGNPRDPVTEVDLKKAVKVARRHATIAGDFRHAGLAIAEMRKAFLGGGDDLGTGVFFGHAFLERACRPAMLLRCLRVAVRIEGLTE